MAGNGRAEQGGSLSSLLSCESSLSANEIPGRKNYSTLKINSLCMFEFLVEYKCYQSSADCTYKYN